MIPFPPLHCNCSQSVRLHALVSSSLKHSSQVLCNSHIRTPPCIMFHPNAAMSLVLFFGCIDLVLFVSTYLDNKDATRFLTSDRYMTLNAIKKHKIHKTVDYRALMMRYIYDSRFGQQTTRIINMSMPGQLLGPRFDGSSLPCNLRTLHFRDHAHYDLRHFTNYPDTLHTIYLEKGYSGNVDNIPFNGQIMFINSKALSQQIVSKAFIHKLYSFDDYYYDDIMSFHNQYGFKNSFDILIDSRASNDAIERYLMCVQHITVDRFSDLEKFLNFIYYEPYEDQIQDHLHWRYPQFEHLTFTLNVREEAGCKCGKCKSTFSLYELVREMLCYFHGNSISLYELRTIPRKQIKNYMNGRITTIQRFFEMYNNLNKMYYTPRKISVNHFDLSRGTVEINIVGKSLNYCSMHDIERKRVMSNNHEYTHKVEYDVIGQYPHFAVCL